MGERQHSITTEVFTNFLLEGAFLRYRGQWQLLIGPFKTLENANNSNKSVFCPPFYSIQDEPSLEAEVLFILNDNELKELCQSYLSQNPLVAEHIFTRDFQEPELADFEISLNVMQEKIKNGEIQKAVPVVFAKLKHVVSKSEKAQLLLNLINAPETLYPYGFWQGSKGCLGATPEILFSTQDAELKTMALAGTCPKTEATSRLSLLEDEKEMYEHQLVVDDIQARLAQLGRVIRGSVHILELPSLFHLKTDINVNLEKHHSLQELSGLLHPTPALGVSPRSYGYAWMEQLPDQTARDYYGAPFGVSLEKEAVCLVGIRNIQWNQDSVTLGSGCGIVAASELQREWRELFQKRLSVKKILGLKL